MDWLFVLEFMLVFGVSYAVGKAHRKQLDHRLDCTGSNNTGQPGSVYQ